MREGLNYKWGWNNKLQNYLWLLFFFEQKIITKGSQSNLEVSIKEDVSEKFQSKIHVVGLCLGSYYQIHKIVAIKGVVHK